MLRERVLLLCLLITSSLYGADDCNPQVGIDLVPPKNPLQDCTSRRIINKRRACECAAKNKEIFGTSKAKITKSAKKALNQVALDKVKIAYLNLLENFSTLQTSYQDQKLPGLKKMAPSCDLKTNFNKLKCGTKNTLYSSAERKKMVGDFQEQLINEAQFYRKGKTPPGQTKGLIDRSKNASQNSCKDTAITDVFVGDMRDKAAERTTDLLVAPPEKLKEILSIDKAEALKSLNQENPNQFISVSELSFKDLLDYHNQKHIFDGNTDGLEAHINNSPILKNVFNDPRHLDQIMAGLKSDYERDPEAGTSFFRNYYEKVRSQSDPYHKMVFDNMNTQCQNINEQFQKVLCLPEDANILPTPKDRKGFTKAKRLLLESQDHYEEEPYSLVQFNSSLILDQSICNPGYQDGIYTDLEKRLNKDLSGVTKNRSAFEDAITANHKDLYENPANDICKLMPQSLPAADLALVRTGNLTENQVSAIAQRNCADKQSLDTSCIEIAKASLKTLYGFNGEKGILGVVENALEAEALAEVQDEYSDRNLKPEQVDQLVAKRLEEKKEAISTQDLMQAYSKIKDNQLQGNKSDLVGQLFSPAGPNKLTPKKSSDIEASSVYSSNRVAKVPSEDKLQGQKFSLANINNSRKNLINSAKKRSPPTGNIYHEIIKRARVTSKRPPTSRAITTAPSSNTPLSASQKRKVVNDAIGSFNPPKSIKPDQSVAVSDFEVEDEEVNSQIARDTKPDQVRPDIKPLSSGAPTGFSDSTLTPEELKAKQFNDALASAVEAKKKALNPDPTSKAKVLGGEVSTSEASATGGTNLVGASIDVSGFNEANGNVFDQVLEAGAADKLTGISPDFYDSIKGWLESPKKYEEYQLVDQVNPQNIYILYKDSSYLDHQSGDKKLWKIRTKLHKKTNQKAENFENFEKAVKGSRHIQNSFRDFFITRKKESAYQKFLKELDTEN